MIGMGYLDAAKTVGAQFLSEVEASLLARVGEHRYATVGGDGRYGIMGVNVSYIAGADAIPLEELVVKRAVYAGGISLSDKHHHDMLFEEHCGPYLTLGLGETFCGQVCDLALRHGVARGRKNVYLLEGSEMPAGPKRLTELLYVSRGRPQVITKYVYLAPCPEIVCGDFDTRNHLHTCSVPRGHS